MEIWAVLIVLAIVVVSIENQVEKFLGVKRREISETPGKIVQRWGRTIIVVFLYSPIFLPLYRSLMSFYTTIGLY